MSHMFTKGQISSYFTNRGMNKKDAENLAVPAQKIVYASEDNYEFILQSALNLYDNKNIDSAKHYLTALAEVYKKDIG